jgi:phosphate transport system substrate-binding protein
MKSLTRLRLVFVAVVATVVVGSVVPADAQSLPAIEGAGSSFPQLEIEQWRSDVKKEFNLRLNYVSSGSTFGRNQYMDGLVDFGVSDIPFQPDEVSRAASRPYVYVPISAGGVGFMYNLKDRNGRRVGFPRSAGGTGTDLKLSPRTACRLLSESGMKWNDPELAADNPDIALPDQTVTAVVRSDGSGTGYVVTEFCIASAPQVWAAFVAYIKSQPALAAGMGGDPFLDGKATSRWPFGWRGSVGYFAGDGVANAVASDTSGNGSITYVEAGFAEVRQFPNALVRNAANVYHYPEALHVNIALKYATRNGDGTVRLDYNTPDPEAYFPSSYSYAIAPTNISPDKGRSLATFLQYAVTRGQEKADQLGYAPLSGEIATIALDAIDRIPGAPSRPALVTFTPKGKGGGVSGGSGTPAPSGNPGGGNVGTPADGGGGAPAGGGGGTGDTGAGTQSGAGPAAAPGAPTGGAQNTGGNVSAPGAPAAASGATSSGATPAGATATGAGATATGAGTAARPSGAVNNAAGGGVAARTGGGAALQTSGTSDVTRTTSSPSNVDVIIAVLQGAAFCAAAAALARRFQMRSAT